MARRILPLLAAAALLSACATTPSTPEHTPDAPPAAASTTPAATPSPTPTPAPVSATITLTGDLLWHDSFWWSAQRDAAATGNGPYDFNPLFATIKPIIEAADLSICHEEVAFGNPEGPFSQYPIFVVPPQAAPAIKATGWDLCTTASNHSVDGGTAGLRRTLDVLDAAGLGHVGTARTKAESDKPVIVDVKGIKVGIVTGTYSTNGIPVEEDWMVHRWDTDAMLARAKATRAAGADFVMVAMHGGEEYQTMPTAQQEALATALTASPDVDLVYGHHVHVLQPWTRINGKLVIYGLGNLIAQGIEARTFEGIIAQLTITKSDGRTTLTEAAWTPTLTTRSPQGNPAIRVNPIGVAKAQGLDSPAALDAALTRTRATVNALGVTGVVEK